MVAPAQPMVPRSLHPTAHLSQGDEGRRDAQTAKEAEAAEAQAWAVAAQAAKRIRSGVNSEDYDVNSD